MSMPMPMPMPMSMSMSMSMSMPVSVLYLCLCPGLCGFKDGFACYVSTHFRYILTTLVLIRNTFYFTTLKINAYLFFRRGYGKLIV